MSNKKYFVYGTLMQLEILTALGLRMMTSEPCALSEVTLYKANSGRFPFMVQTFDPRDSVKGLLVTLDLLDPDSKYSVDEILDHYEGAYGDNPLYHRIDTGEMVYYLANRGNSYVMMQLSPDNLIGGDWNEFRKQA